MFFKKRNKYREPLMKLNYDMLGKTIDYLKNFEYRDFKNRYEINILYYYSPYNSLGHQTFKIDENIEIKIVRYGYIQDYDPLRDENKTLFYNFLRIVIVINKVDVVEFDLEEKQSNRWSVSKINKKFEMSQDIDRVINTWCYKQLKQKETEENRLKELQEYEEEQKRLEHQQVQEKLNEIYKQYRKRG